MKKISIKLLVATAAVLSLQGVAFAQSKPASGWYAGGSIGQAEIKPQIDFAASTASQDKTSTGYKIMAGYQFDQTWAVEAQYFNLGKYKYNDPGFETFNIKDNGVSVAVAGFYPLSADFSLLGKAGVAVHNFKAKYHGPGITDSESKVETALLLGAGVEYNISPTLALRGEYEYLGKPKALETKIRTSLFSVGLRYKF